jgi:hypothetical protein
MPKQLKSGSDLHKWISKAQLQATRLQNMEKRKQPEFSSSIDTWHLLFCIRFNSRNTYALLLSTNPLCEVESSPSSLNILTGQE